MKALLATVGSTPDPIRKQAHIVFPERSAEYDYISIIMQQQTT